MRPTREGAAVIGNYTEHRGDPDGWIVHWTHFRRPEHPCTGTMTFTERECQAGAHDRLTADLRRFGYSAVQ